MNRAAMDSTMALAVVDLAYSWIHANAESRADIDLAEDVLAASEAFRALVTASQRTVDAFRDLSTAPNFVVSHARRKECESAMLALDAALKSAGGAA